MTLFKQIAIMLTLLLLSILTTVMFLMFTQASESLQSRLYEDAQNTAASLSLSLGVSDGDLSTMQTMINANFDSGHYAMISLMDMDEHILYKRVKETTTTSKVPKWFKERISLEAPIASANVSSGWNPVGILNVQSDSDYAYEQLYVISKDLLISFGVIFFVSLGLLYIAFSYTLKPLKTIQKQAEAITHNEFIIQKKIPYTKEFRDVVIAMNVMVKKVQTMFEKANAELRKLREREYTDPVTKLKNRKYFINKLPEFLKIDASSRFGTNMLIAFNGVIEANKEIGYKQVDGLFLKMAALFEEHVQQFQEHLAVRLNGTEFAILLPECSVRDAAKIAEKIKWEIQEMIISCGLDPEVTYVDIGLHQYSHKETISVFMAKSDNALAKAKLADSHIHFEESEHDDEVMGKDEWRETIKNALQSDNLEMVAYKVLDTKDNRVIHETLTANLITADVHYTYGQFIAPAMQLGLVEDINKKMIEILLSKYNSVFEGKICSLRLSKEFLEENESFVFLQETLQNHARKLSFKLIVEMPDKFISQHRESVEAYKKLFDRFDIRMGVFEFIGESGDYYYLQELKPVYIKSEKSFFLTLEEHNLGALKVLTDSIDIDLIAVGIMDEENLKKLQEKDIYVVQGRVVELIKNG